MTTCMIMHNMIVEDEGEAVRQGLDFQHMGASYPASEAESGGVGEISPNASSHYNRGTHTGLQND